MGWVSPELIAARVSPDFGREVTAANIRYLAGTKLAPRFDLDDRLHEPVRGVGDRLLAVVRWRSGAGTRL